ncbi:DUF3857 domain-containing protein [Pareuzebyella sediminis]|uniref:DUF3857 domain-containing protein n=1 Tax=Pareuzebyella sediminis TaxID=2607998 RepID=UPI0011F03D41|nr:DUF3857 domain-containing protein [Pareuzebyella sediminis]
MRHFILVYFFFLGFLAFSQKTDYQALNLNKALTENANAVVRVDEMVVELSALNSMNIRHKRAVTVLNEKGNAYATVYVGYDKGRKVKNIQAVVYDASGKECDKIKEKEFKDVSAVDGSTLYSDSRYKYYHYTPIEYPYTIELTYETTTKNTGEIPSVWRFLDDFRVSTEKSSLSINYARPDLKPAVKEKNLEGIVYSKDDNDKGFSFEARNIPALKEESMSPSFKEIAPQIMVRPVNFQYEGYDAKIDTWKDLGLWMSGNLLKGRDELLPATKEKVKTLVKDANNDLEKAKIIYKYVQENTRYISVQVGIGGIQPINAIEVDRLKYGDCKGLSNYTKALLNSVGVEAYYVHVEAGREKVDFEEEFPDLAQGNHVILAVPYEGKYHWIDCTSQVHPFGFIGDFTDDRKVLVIKPDGGEIVRTVAYTNEQNYQLTQGSYALRTDGSINGNVTIRTRGIQYDNHFTLAQRPEDKIQEHYKNYWHNINNLKVKTYRFQNDDSAVEFTEEVSVDASHYASKSGERLLFAANAFNNFDYIPDRYYDRKLPFEIQRGFLDEDEFSIEIPDGYGVESMPEAMTVENKFGYYRIDFTFSEGKIFLQRKFLVKKGTYPNSDYTAYRDFMKEVSKNDSAKIVIKPIL